MTRRRLETGKRAAAVFKANKSYRRRGAVGRGALVPRYVADTARRGDTILDFGAGTYADHAAALRDQGLRVTAFDFGLNWSDKVHSPRALEKKYDVVFASNVLNVQEYPVLVEELLDLLAGLVKARGRLVLNLPTDPRYGAWLGKKQDVDDLVEALESRFKEVERVGGRPGAPVLEARLPLRRNPSRTSVEIWDSWVTRPNPDDPWAWQDPTSPDWDQERYEAMITEDRREASVEATLFGRGLGSPRPARREPRIRARKGTQPDWWRYLSGPYRTRRKAFRVARAIRDGDYHYQPEFREHIGTQLVVISIDPPPGRKLPEWWVVTRKEGVRRNPRAIRFREPGTETRLMERVPYTKVGEDLYKTLAGAYAPRPDTSFDEGVQIRAVYDGLNLTFGLMMHEELTQHPSVDKSIGHPLLITFDGTVDRAKRKYLVDTVNVERVTENGYGYMRIHHASADPETFDLVYDLLEEIEMSDIDWDPTGVIWTWGRNGDLITAFKGEG